MANKNIQEVWRIALDYAVHIIYRYMCDCDYYYTAPRFFFSFFYRVPNNISPLLFVPPCIIELKAAAISHPCAAGGGQLLLGLACMYTCSSSTSSWLTDCSSSSVVVSLWLAKITDFSVCHCGVSGTTKSVCFSLTPVKAAGAAAAAIWSLAYWLRKEKKERREESLELRSLRHKTKSSPNRGAVWAVFWQWHCAPGTLWLQL